MKNIPKLVVLFAMSLPIFIAMNRVEAQSSGHDTGYLSAMRGSIPSAGIYESEKYGFFKGECVSYVAYRLNKAGLGFTNGWRSSEVSKCPTPTENNSRISAAKWNAGRWSHAWQWYYKAKHIGLTANTTPAVNSVYCSLSESSWGHVGVVDSVNFDGTANISEYNRRNDHKFQNSRKVRADGRTSFYIHFIKPAEPEIQLTGLGGFEIRAGDTTPSGVDGTDFGRIRKHSSKFSVFSIKNTGPGDLRISSVSLSGSSAFRVSNGLRVNTTYFQPIVIRPGASLAFTIQFTPTSIFSAVADFEIRSNDADEARYSFKVKGSGI